MKGHARNHRRSRRGSVAEHRSARTSHRDAAGPAGADGVGVQRPGPSQANGSAASSTRTRSRRWTPKSSSRSSARSPRCTASPASMARRAHDLCVVVAKDYDGNAEKIWKDAKSGDELFARLRALPGYGDEKSKIFVAILAKRMNVKPEGWEAVARPVRRPHSPLGRRHRQPGVAREGAGVEEDDEGEGQDEAGLTLSSVASAESVRSIHTGDASRVCTSSACRRCSSARAPSPNVATSRPEVMMHRAEEHEGVLDDEELREWRDGLVAEHACSTAPAALHADAIVHTIGLQ